MFLLIFYNYFPPMPSHLHYVTYCFASQSFTLDIAQLKNLLYSLLRKVLAHLSTVHVCLFKSEIYKL